MWRNNKRQHRTAINNVVNLSDAPSPASHQYWLQEATGLCLSRTHDKTSMNKGFYKVKIGLYGLLVLADAWQLWLKTCHKNPTRFVNSGDFVSRRHGLNLGKNLDFLLIYCSFSQRSYGWFSFGIQGIIHNLMWKTATSRAMGRAYEKRR
jgi:hypothetical protein